MKGILSRKILVIGIIFLFVGMGTILPIKGDEIKKQCLTHDRLFSFDFVERTESEMVVDTPSTKTIVLINNSLPDLEFIELRAWWGSLNTTGIFVDYDIYNSGDTYYSEEPIVSNLSFFADDNTTSFGYILQSPLFYPSVWYPGEILGGCNFFEMDEKPETITVKIDFNNSIPESNETNNNLTILVLLGVTISGSIYKNINGEMIPYNGKIELNEYNDISLSDFGYRNFWSDENGHYNMSLCPDEPLNISHIYNIMASDISNNLKMLKKSNPVKPGGNTTMNFSFGSPPNKPDKPFGRKIGMANRTYLFFSSTSDSNDNQIYYKFSWGDAIFSNWIGPYIPNEIISASYAWNKSGSNSIQVISMNSQGMLSEWSDPLKINIPENKQLNSQLLLQFLEKLKEMFSIYR